METASNLERDASPDPYFFFSGTEKEKYKGQGMKSLAGFGAEPHKVEFHPEGSYTGPGAILEYDPIKAKTQLRVYGKDDPEGDPVAVYSMS